MTPPLFRTAISIVFALAVVTVSMATEWRNGPDYGELLVGLSFVVFFYTPPLIPFICLVLVPTERLLSEDPESAWRILLIAPLLGLAVPALIFFLFALVRPGAFDGTFIIFVMSGACGLAWGVSYFLPKRKPSEQHAASP